MERRQINHIGIHYQKSNLEATVGKEVEFKTKPVKQVEKDAHNEKVFEAVEAGKPKIVAGDKSTSTFKVYGGACGKECDEFRINRSRTHDDAEDNVVASCIARTFDPAELPPDNEVFNFPAICPDGEGEEDEQSPTKIGTISIKNLGSQMPNSGYPVEGGVISDTLVSADPIAPISGDWLHWGLGRLHAKPDLAAGGARFDYMECDCNGVPQWYAVAANRDPNLTSDIFDPAGGGYTWSPCSSGCKLTTTGADGGESYKCYDRTYFCSGVVWLGTLKPGETAVYDLAPATGVTLKFVSGPGFYTRMANAGMAVNGLYRDCRLPSCDAEVVVYPKTDS